MSSEVTVSKAARRHRGLGVASWLSGAWRPAPPPLDDPSGDVARLLADTGAGGLAWWRLRLRPDSKCPQWGELEQVYRFYAIQAAVRRREMREAVGRLNAAGIEPVVSKGWAIARWYPHAALRPYRDVDLFVAPAAFARAEEALREKDDELLELHCGVPELADRGMDRLLGRATPATLDGARFRFLALEDELRHLCLHLLKHSVSRPLWLCDVALLLENLPADFRWEWCLGGDRRRGDWVLCTLRLAHELLGASLDRADERVRARRLPAWLVPSVLEHWGTAPEILPSLTVDLRSPARLAAALRRRWPTAVRATVHRSADFSGMPRLPIKIAYVIARGGAWIRKRVLEHRGDGGRVADRALPARLSAWLPWVAVVSGMLASG